MYMLALLVLFASGSHFIINIFHAIKNINFKVVFPPLHILYVELSLERNLSYHLRHFMLAICGILRSELK
jgi:hypothetical protein